MMDRISTLRELLIRFEADALLLAFLPDIRWATGFTGSNGLLFVSAQKAVFLTDGRYTTQAATEVQHARVAVVEGNMFDALPAQTTAREAAQVLIQSEHLTLYDQARLTAALPEAGWKQEAGWMRELVARKTDAELDLMRQAQRITEAAFEAVLGRIEVGMSEKEIAAHLTFEQLRLGAERMSFDPIVASGPNSALPHARPTDRKVGTGEVLLLDFGCVFEGYASDMTRTVFVGEPDPEARRVYGVVREAQERALRGARAGMAANALDALARDVIAAAGYDGTFTHGLGHGVGLQIHEWPRVSKQSDEPLPGGAVVTIEPGIYLPGRFGVRIEDMIVLREDGADNLTRASKDPVVL